MSGSAGAGGFIVKDGDKGGTVRREVFGTSFAFYQVDSAKPGRDLDMKEQDWINAGGGKKSVTGSGLTNTRNQVNIDKYRTRGGKVTYCK